MNFWNLKYFIDIAEQGSISAAARLNLVSQQSMSAQLKKLEEEYNTPLLVRGTPLKMTAAGQLLYTMGKDILDKKAELDAAILSLQQTEVLTIGFVFDDIPAYMNDLWIRFQETYAGSFPKIVLVQDCRNHPERLSQVDIYFGKINCENLFTPLLLRQDTIHLVVSQKLLALKYTNPVQREQVLNDETDHRSRKLFQELPFVLMTPTAQQESNKLVSEDYVPRHVLFHTDNMALRVSMCRQGQCAILMPEHSARQAFRDEHDIFLFPMHNHRKTEFWISYRADKKLSECALHFLRVTEAFFA